MDYIVGQKVAFCGLCLLGSTHHLPIEPRTLTSVCMKWLPKYLIIFVLSVLLQDITPAASYGEFS